MKKGAGAPNSVASIEFYQIASQNAKSYLKRSKCNKEKPKCNRDKSKCDKENSNCNKEKSKCNKEKSNSVAFIVFYQIAFKNAKSYLKRSKCNKEMSKCSKEKSTCNKEKSKYNTEKSNSVASMFEKISIQRKIKM